MTPAPRGQLLGLVTLLSSALFYSLFNNRPLRYELSLLLALALAVVWTWRGLGTAAPAHILWPGLAFGLAYLTAALSSQDVARSLRELPIIIGYGLLFVLAGNLLELGVARATLFRAVVLASLVMSASAVGVWWMDGAALAGYRLRFETNNSAALDNVLLFPALVTGELAGLVIAPAAFVTWFGGSRGGLVATGAGLAALVSLWPAVRRWRWPILAGGALAGALVWLYVSGLPHGNRNELWTVAWEMFSARPWAGQGPETYQAFFMRAYPAFPDYDHAHNVLFNLLAETGLRGALTALILAAVAGWELWRRARAGDQWALGALAACAALAVQSMVDVPTTRSYVVGALLLVVRLGLGVPAAAIAESGEPSGSALEHRRNWRGLPAPHAIPGDGALACSTTTSSDVTR